MTNKHNQKCSTLLVTRAMQVKITMKPLNIHLKGQKFRLIIVSSGKDAGQQELWECKMHIRRHHYSKNSLAASH